MFQIFTHFKAKSIARFRAVQGNCRDVVFDFEHEGEIFHLMQLARLIRHSNAPRDVNLHMPYLPYGRQDKQVSNETTFALEVFTDLLRLLRFTKITTLDAHSNKSDHTVESIYPEKEINLALKHSKAEAVAFPDKGAQTRYVTELPFVIGDKVRNPETGYIEKYGLVNSEVIKLDGQKILIIDDICDGGMTFILLAKELYKKGAGEVYLYTTHGIFSKGIKPLHEAGIKRIFTKDGEIFPSKDTRFLTKELK